MKTLKQLLEERKAKLNEVQNLQKESETRDLTDDEEKRVDSILDEIETLDGEIAEKRASDEEKAERQKKRDARMASLAGAGNDGASLGGSPRAAEARSEDPDDPVENPDPNKYRILRAINRIANNRPVDGYEGEISQEIAKREDREPQGFFLPTNLRVMPNSNAERRALTTTTASGAVPTIQAPTMIELLRNRTTVINLGATLITGLSGNFDIPKQTGAGTSYWVAEEGEPTASNQTIGQIQFSPTTHGAYTDISRRATVQTSLDLNNFVINDLTRVMAIGLDLAAINGSGASNQPLGILQDSNLATVAIAADGGALTRDHVLQLERDVAVGNADMNTMGFLTNPKVRKKAKETLLDAGSGRFLWGGDNTVEGYGTAVTNQIPSNLTKGSGTDLSAMIYGDFSTVFIAFWTGLDVMVDPYSLSKSGGIRIVCLQDCQIKYRHNESLVKIVDIDTT